MLHLHSRGCNIARICAFLISILHFVDAFYFAGKYTGRSNEMYCTNKETPIIKLPIVQIIGKNELLGEIICGNDLKDCVVKLKATLEAMDKRSDHTDETAGYIQNLYTDSMLTDAMNEDPNAIVVLKIYRNSCKKCAKLDPIFASFPELFKNNFRWLQAESSDIPDYIKITKTRLLGIYDEE